MFYLDFLRRMHELMHPASYLEIGIRHGDSLALTSSPSVGIDPAYDLRCAMPDGVTLYRGTSDDYFASDAIDRDLPDGRIDLSFIDGLHWFEYALRDFVNVEARSSSYGIVVMDDMLPRSQAEATREINTVEWTGDVWKVIPTLVRRRPDLTLFRVATQPTGLLVIAGLDRGNTELSKHYDAILAEVDGAPVPDDILDRAHAVSPEEFLRADFWTELRARTSDSTADGLPESVRAWVPARPLDAAEVEATKKSPHRDELINPTGLSGVLTRTRRRVLRIPTKLRALTRSGSAV